MMGAHIEESPRRFGFVFNARKPPTDPRPTGETYVKLLADHAAVLVLEPQGKRIAVRCAACGGATARAVREGVADRSHCEPCGDVGFIGIDPTRPIVSPDTQARAACYRARYVAGLPLWNPADLNGELFGKDAGNNGIEHITTNRGIR